MDYRVSSCLVAVVAILGCGATPTSPTPPQNPPTTTPTIGSAGGTVTSADGRARLEVPAGALTTPTTLSLQSSSSFPLDPAVVGQSAYDVIPAGVQFGVPATLRVTYAPALRPSGVAEEELRLHRVVSGAWTGGLAGGAIDVTSDVARAEVASGGTYGVRWPDPTAACDRAEDRQFDFWLGTWAFSQTVPVTSTGVNVITRDTPGCRILEHFNDGRGKSVSFFSRVDSRWHQTYVDTDGNRIVMSGQLEDGRMRLYSSPNARWTWERIDAATIRYFGEAQAGGTWLVGFDSRYTAR